MQRTSVAQDDSREASVPSRESDPAVLSLIERGVHTMPDSEPLSAAVERLLSDSPWGVALVDRGGIYRGCCTIRSISTLCLLINGETAALLSTLRFLSDDMGRIRERIGAAMPMPCSSAIDPFVPTIARSASLPEVYFHFYRGQTLLPVVEADDGRLVGVISCERAVAAAVEGNAGGGR
jgi:hypothetical protein